MKKKEEGIERGELFKIMRKASDFTIEKASEKLFISSRTLVNYENGSHQVPFETQVNMIKLYHIDGRSKNND